jgi:hypothetical protein
VPPAVSLRARRRRYGGHRLDAVPIARVIAGPVDAETLHRSAQLATSGIYRDLCRDIAVDR